MSSKSDTGSLNVVDLASSDEDENPRLKTKTSIPSSQTLPTPTFNESRSFWKAGAYDVVASTSQTSSQGFLEHARIHPKFLHTNATSHKWAFGAIAELLDNAVDEICNGATYVKVDKIYNRKDNSPALLFQDNGGGMNPEGMRKCMSLGYSSKKTNTTIGQYGNGFKTSTMRLGADAIVFSRNICGNHATQSIGLLSYTFLRRTGLDDIIVPMIDFDLFDHGSQPITYGSQNDWTNNLKTILDWSPFSSRDDLMLQFEDIGPHGTKVIVYNLWLDDDGLLELDFDYNDEDIRLNEEGGNTGNFLRVRRELLQSHISYCYRFSLRAYASILYLQRFSGFQIILRGKPVQQISIVDDLKFPKVISYRPQLAIASKEATVETTIGFVKEAPALQVHGVNIYHKNRLIMPFFTVVPSGSSRGQGVVGVLEANFIEPAHDKQDFERTALFIRLEAKLKQIIVDYWLKNSHFIGLPRPRCEKPKTSQAPTSCPPVGLSNMQKNVPHSQSFVGVPANTWAPSERNERHDTTPASYYPVRDAAEPPCSRDPARQSVAFDNEVTDISGTAFVDTICDENIQLFMRSENYRQKEAELKQMVEDLQGELEEKRRKCLQLALSIQLQRKQKSLNP